MNLKSDIECFVFMKRIATSLLMFFVAIADFVVAESELVLKRFLRSRSKL